MKGFFIENATIFFCDIHGTIKGNIENKETDHIKLNNFLNSISINNDNCKIIFTFVNSESKEELNKIKYFKCILRRWQYFSSEFNKWNIYRE